MDGRKLFKKAVECLEEITRWTLEKAQRGGGARLSLMVPHQANIRIINALAQRLGMAADRVYTTIERYGNTSSASIPIALAEAVSAGRLCPRDKLLMVTFGAGLTWGASLVSGPSSGARGVLRPGGHVWAAPVHPGADRYLVHHLHPVVFGGFQGQASPTVMGLGPGAGFCCGPAG